MTQFYANALVAVNVNLELGVGLLGEANGDTVVGFEAILGSAFNDTLFGSVASGETIHGGAGFDRLNGGAGFDVLTGGSGTDWFILMGTNFDNDRVTDFEDGVDRIVFRASTGVSEFADIIDFRQAGSDVVIETAAGNVRLENINVADITEADFIFG